MPGVYDAGNGEIAYLTIGGLDFCYLQDLQVELINSLSCNKTITLL